MVAMGMSGGGEMLGCYGCCKEEDGYHHHHSDVMGVEMLKSFKRQPGFVERVAQKCRDTPPTWGWTMGG